MELITVVDDMPVFNPEVRMIKEFKRLLERDKGSKGDHDGRKKHVATKELCFIYFWCAYDSRFDAFEGKEKTKILKEYLDLPEKWKVDDDIKAAVKAYRFLTETPSMRLYKKMVEGVKNIEDFIDDVDLEKTTKSGTLVFSPEKLVKVITDLPKTIQALNDADKIIKKEIQDKKDKKAEELSSGDREGTEAKIKPGF